MFQILPMTGPAAAGDPRDRQTYLIIGAALAVHHNLGPGFLEAVYQKALETEFRERGVPYEREQRVLVYYRGTPLGIGYRADFVCFGDILVELKGIPRLTPADQAQVMNYLVASNLSRALLVNFGGPSLQVRRFVGRGYTPIET